MNLQCRKCGEQIAVGAEILESATPRVVCPRCETRYRLKKTRAPESSGEMPASEAPGPPESTGGSAEASSEAPSETSSEASSSPPPVPEPAAASSSTGARTVSDALARPPERKDDVGNDAEGDAPIFEPGEVLTERYRIVSFLARGGMGEVYEAEDLELRQDVALKTIGAGLGEESGVVDRFKREIALARMVTHPNVCRIFDLGTHRPDGGEPVIFLSMELLRGETLTQLLRRRHRLPTHEALPLIRQMCKGLDAAHSVQVVHRDFKSENVFLESRNGSGAVEEHRVVITDFGVARGGEAADRFAAQVTGLGIVGTPAYMAPEQVENKVVTHAADIYALGIVIYEMVTGRLPFESESPLTTAVKRLREPPPPPHIHAPDLPAWWERAILRCLERRPDERFSTAEEVADALLKPARPSRRDAKTATRLDSAPTVVRRPPETSAECTSTPASTVSPATATLRGGLVMGAGTDAGRHPAGESGDGSTGTVLPAATGDAPKGRRATHYLLAALLLVVALSAGLAWFNADDGLDPSRVEPRRSVAVVGFENLSGHEGADWLSTALAEMVGTELGRGAELRTFAGARVADARRQAGLGPLDELGEEELTRLRALLGCDFVVTGSYVALGPGGEIGSGTPIRLDVSLEDAAVGRTITTVSEQGTSDQLFEMIARVGDRLRETLDVGGGVDDPMSGVPENPRANRLYAQALDALRAGRPQEARDLLEKAADLEPENPLIHTYLASAWSALGYSSRAVEEARRAFESSSGLSREDRLLVEGRYRRLSGDWPAARRVYGELWKHFPDNLDYGLELVNAEISAGRPDEAFATLDELRRLPAALSDDPRLPLAEARAAAAASRLELQKEAARQAAEAAEARGADLLVAQARLLLAQAQRHLGELDAAESSARRAAEIYERLDHPVGRALAVTALANAFLDRGLYADAADGYRQAAELYRRVGDRGGTSASLNNLAVVRKKEGDLAAAQELYAENEEIYREIDDRRGLATTLNNLAVVLVERDRLRDARALLERVEEIWSDLGPAALAYHQNNEAEVLRGMGELGESRALHEGALEARRSAGRRLDLVISLANLGSLELALGEIQAAREHLREARELAEAVDEPSARAIALHRLAELHLEEARPDEARAALEASLEIRRRLENEAQILAGRIALARLTLAEGLHGRAALLAEKALEEAKRDGRRAEAANAAAVLVTAKVGEGGPALEEARRIVEDHADLRHEVENVEAAWRLGLAAARLEAAEDPRSSLEAFDQLIAQARSTGLRLLELRARVHRALARSRLGGEDAREAAAELREAQLEAAAAGAIRISDLAGGARPAETTAPGS